MLPDLSGYVFGITLHPDVTTIYPAPKSEYASFLNIRTMDAGSGAFTGKMGDGDPLSDTGSPVTGTVSENRPGGYAITFTVTIGGTKGGLSRKRHSTYTGGLVMGRSGWSTFMAGTVNFSGSRPTIPATDVPFCAMGTDTNVQ
jgi:hypothetical protein